MDGGGSDGAPTVLTITYSASADADLGATATIAAGGNDSTVQAPDAGDRWYADMTAGVFSAQNSGSEAGASAQLAYTLDGGSLTFTATTQAGAGAPFADGIATARLSGTLTVRAPGLIQVTLQSSCSAALTASAPGTAEIDLAGDHGPYNAPDGDYCSAVCNLGVCTQWTAAGEPDGPTSSVTIPAVDGEVDEHLSMYIGCLAATYDAGFSDGCSAVGTLTVDITPGY